MKQASMSTPDLILNAFVIVMSLWAIYNKWIAPRIAAHNKRKETKLLATMLNEQSKPPLRQPIPTTSPPILTKEFLLAAKYDITSAKAQVVAAVAETSAEEEDIASEEEEEEEEHFDIEDKIEDEESSETEMEDEEEEPEEDDETPAEVEETHAEVRETRPVRRFLTTKNLNNPRAEWNKFVSSLLSSINHLIVIGASGGGKTMTMYDLVRFLLEQGIEVVVCDPDAAQGDWPGADVYGGGDDWQSINGVLKEMANLMKERRIARTEGIREFEPMWFVVDEYGDIAKECDAANAVVENGLRRARKLNIHLMIGVQDTQVKTMGFERKSSLLEHAQIIKLVKRLDGSRILQLNGETTMKVPNFDPSAAIPPQKLKTLTETEWIDSSNSDPCDPEESTGDDAVDSFETEDSPDGKEQVIMGLIQAGWSYARIVEKMGTSSARISRIKRKMLETAA